MTNASQLLVPFDSYLFTTVQLQLGGGGVLARGAGKRLCSHATRCGGVRGQGECFGPSEMAQLNSEGSNGFGEGNAGQQGWGGVGGRAARDSAPRRAAPQERQGWAAGVQNRRVGLRGGGHRGGGAQGLQGRKEGQGPQAHASLESAVPAIPSAGARSDAQAGGCVAGAALPRRWGGPRMGHDGGGQPSSHV